MVIHVRFKFEPFLTNNSAEPKIAALDTEKNLKKKICIHTGWVFRSCAIPELKCGQVTNILRSLHKFWLTLFRSQSYYWSDTCSVLLYIATLDRYFCFKAYWSNRTALLYWGFLPSLSVWTLFHNRPGEIRCKCMWHRESSLGYVIQSRRFIERRAIRNTSRKSNTAGVFSCCKSLPYFHLR